jgi:hypothetical protein
VLRVRASGIATFVLTFLLLAAASSHAQAPPQTLPPVPGFVPSYEVMRTLRLAGFDPLAPPLREDTTYVVRANDYRGILMRVVVDARTGAIRDANRIVPAPGSDIQLGMMPPYEETPDTVPPPEVTGALPPPSRPASRATALPPLPRLRPAELASNPAGALTPAIATTIKPDMKPDVTGAVPAVAPTAPVAPVPPVAKPSRVPPPLTINN